MVDPYEGREQTEAKHFILRRYLQELAFKVLSAWDTLTFVDGFSGPWKSRMPDFSDTSFMIAIEVLKDVQQRFSARGKRKTIKCYFVEKKPGAYAQLDPAVKVHHDPDHGFHIETFGGEFEDAVPNIASYIQGSFALIFIDPTGWTGFAFDKIAAVLRHRDGEVFVNIMYDHMIRFINSDDPATEKSFEAILGGPGWKERLDEDLPRGQALLKLFREVLKKAGAYEFATTTCIERATVDRPHYFLAYGTRNPAGIKAFRQVEWDGLRRHEGARRQAKADRKEKRTGQGNLFPPNQLSDDSSVEAIVEENMREAKKQIMMALRRRGRPITFKDLWSRVLEAFMLRVTNVKDICVELASEGVIEETWTGDGKQKPHDQHMIILR